MSVKSTAGPEGVPPPVVLSPRAFWAIFASAWIAYAGLACSGFLFQGEDIRSALIGTLGTVTPLVLPAVFLALYRRRFLEPQRSIGRFIGHKALVGVGYGLAAAAIGGLLVWLTPMKATTELGDEPLVIFMVLFMTGLFLYTIFLGFLMWSDALERIHESRTLAAREAVLRAQAEAKALRAQFNPHFVFNTLHSLMLLVRKDPATAERAIEDVAALIRYASTLQRREVDQVPLSKELEFARRYISLEKLRLAERLTVDFAIDAGLEDVLVPAFSLQTLLENSIKHGISPKPEGGTVRIRATLENGQVSLVVTDDGLGADPSAVAGNGGSGLHLLEHRLSTVYDGNATLEWETAEGAGFRVTVRIPVRRVPTEIGASE